VYATDNGWIQDPNSPRFAPRSKRSPHEGGLRTPIMFRFPGKIEPRREETSLASTIDLVPTILTACGFESPKDLPGVNLLSETRSEAFGEIFDHDVADIDNPQASLEYRWCIDGYWKLILPKDGKNPELYNLKIDPHENENLATKHPDIVRRLTEKLDRWWKLQP
jgi:uncharacterized sulfatase